MSMQGMNCRFVRNQVGLRMGVSQSSPFGFNRFHREVMVLTWMILGVPQVGIKTGDVTWDVEDMLTKLKAIDSYKLRILLKESRNHPCAQCQLGLGRGCECGLK